MSRYLNFCFPGVRVTPIPMGGDMPRDMVHRHIVSETLVRSGFPCEAGIGSDHSGLGRGGLGQDKDLLHTPTRI